MTNLGYASLGSSTGAGNFEVVYTRRTALLARALGVSAVRLDPAKFAQVGYPQSGGAAPTDAHLSNIENAPWVVGRPANHAASREYLGFVPLSVDGLATDTLTASTDEFIGNGGRSGRPRRATKSLVFDGWIVAKTERGAEFGRQWLSAGLVQSTPGYSGQVLRVHTTANAGPSGSGSYLRHTTVTRAPSVTNSRRRAGHTLLRVTFTLTAGDPRLISETQPGLGWIPGWPSGWSRPSPTPRADDVVAITNVPPAAPDYSPIMDPTAPALVAPPTATTSLPVNWGFAPGTTVWRRWVDFYFPDIGNATHWTLEIDIHRVGVGGGYMALQGVRVAVWTADEKFGAAFTNTPAGHKFRVSGIEETVRTSGTTTPRRADSVAFDYDGGPLKWPKFKGVPPVSAGNDPTMPWLWVTVDAPSEVLPQLDVAITVVPYTV